jgi:two-component system CheB/CheR fusion protein
MVRNLLANALKYTKRGKVLMGCRRHADSLTIEIWDTGIGIPANDLDIIFEEYRQLDNAWREQSRGLGLGLSIVQRLSVLMGHRVVVRSRVGRGSAFTIDVPILPSEISQHADHADLSSADTVAGIVRRSGTILVVEDDPELRDLIALVLLEENHRVVTAPDGIAALDLIARDAVSPDLIVTDQNLPHGLNGYDLITKLRESLHGNIPTIILTGDIATAMSRDNGIGNSVHLNKPVKLQEFTQVVQRLLASMPPTPWSSTVHQENINLSGSASSVIFIVDDDGHMRETMRHALDQSGWTIEDYATCEAFLAAYRPGREACLLVDAYLPGMSGLELLQRLRSAGDLLPSIMITGSSDVPMAVQAMKARASDFIEKPVGRSDLIASITRALDQARDSNKRSVWKASAVALLSDLTPRQQQIMDLVLAGHPSKNIAADLKISQRTVENHRAAIMQKTGSKSLPALARLALAAERTL